MPTDLTAAPDELKVRVHDFWDETPCGTKHAAAPEGTPEFFALRDSARDRLEPFIPQFADFKNAAGKDVLEIGTGMGTDFMRFARSGANLTGVDLTEKSVELVKQRLAMEELSAEVLVADAESLPFDDESFDWVYSWGVLHHTPDTAKATREAVRVLRPGGRLCVMLYGRHSWLAYGLWVRHALLRGRPTRSLAAVLSEHMESEGTKGFTVKELRSMFSELDDLQINPLVTAYDRRVAGPLTRLTGNRLGWFIVIRGNKPSR